MSVELMAFSAADFERRRASMVAEYARKMVDNLDADPEPAAAEAERQTAALLPAGAATPGQHLTKAVRADGTEVGFLWLSTAGLGDPELGWITVIEVEPAYRSQGIGRRLLLAAEDEMRRQGRSRLGLHVFGRNTGAQRLYTRLGYGVRRQIWQRPATPDPAPAIQLRPLPGAEGTARAAYAGDRRVGWVEFALPTPSQPKLGTITALVVEEALRRRGHGRAVVAAVAGELATRGIPYVGLTVPGDEPGARAFAASPALGLELISQQMVKEL